MVNRIWYWLFGNPTADTLALVLFDLRNQLSGKEAECERQDRLLLEYSNSKIRQVETIRKLGVELDECQAKVEDRNATIASLEKQIRDIKKPLFDFDEVGNAMGDKRHCRELND